MQWHLIFYVGEAMRIRHDIKVELLETAGSDRSIAEDALVSSGNDYDENRLAGLINSLLRQKHGSPFESGYMRFLIEAPRAVRDEHVRHRIGSYSSTSLRYRMEDDNMEFYLPPPHRPLQPSIDHKPMRPAYKPLGLYDYEAYVTSLYDTYDFITMVLKQLAAKTETSATEARRWITPDGLYTPYIYRANPRMIMAFLSLRTNHPEANHPSYPMWEIEQVAIQIENLFAIQFPLTYAAFNRFGREAP